MTWHKCEALRADISANKHALYILSLSNTVKFLLVFDTLLLFRRDRRSVLNSNLIFLPFSEASVAITSNESENSPKYFFSPFLKESH